MKKEETQDFGDDFKYILRVAMADVDGTKRIGQGLTSVSGVGQRTATALCKIADLDPKKLGGHLDDDEVSRLVDTIEGYMTKVPLWMLNRQRDVHSGDELHLFSQDVKMVQKEDIDRHRAMKSYRGIRHASGGRVRGQRTRSNNRSGLTLGVERKK